MTIGFFPQNYVNGSNITMLLSEFMVFQRTLTDAQVDALGYELGKKYKITTTFTPPGDYNNDGIVNAADFVVWRQNVGTTNVLPNDPIGGTIGPAQYDQWRANFGNLAGTGLGSGSEFGAVPEPATPLLLLSVAIGWFTLRRRHHAFDEPRR
jgi:hypothetical protein